MADQNAVELLRKSEKMFTKKWQLDSLWQRLAEEFYPERADFTRTRNDGEEFAENLFESTPAQNRRELAYAMGSLMRPPAKRWFKQIPKDKDLLHADHVMEWLGYSTDQMRGIIYSGRSNWQRALPEGDNDVISFGNAVHSLAEGPDRDGTLIYDTHHLRDCAWAEDRYRVVNRLDRKIKLALRNWEGMFPGVGIPEKWSKMREKAPDHEIDIRHVVLPVVEYQSYRKRKSERQRFASVYVDVENQGVIREGFYYEFPYYVRRWLLRAGSPYGYSPAAMLGLIDARVLQAQSRVILDAGELAVRPPILARDEVLGDASLYAGAINWINPDYDESNGEAIRPIEMGGNLNVGLEMKIDTRQLLAAAFYLNKLTLPSDKEMTAYEVGERLNEYIRSIGPVVEPFEADNTALLDQTFTMGLRLGRFGPIEAIPAELRGADLGYEFDSPIQMAYQRQKQMRAKETVMYVSEVAQATGDTSVIDNLDTDRITRDGIRSIDGEAEWLRPFEEIQAKRQAEAEAAAQQQEAIALQEGIATAGAAADTVPKIANAGATIAGLLPPPDQGDGEEEMWPDLGGDEESEQTTGTGQGGGMSPALAAIMASDAYGIPAEAMDAGGEQQEQAPAPSRGDLVRMPEAEQPVSRGRGGDDLKAMLKDLIAAIGADQKVERDAKGRVTGIKRVMKGQ